MEKLTHTTQYDNWEKSIILRNVIERELILEHEELDVSTWLDGLNRTIEEGFSKITNIQRYVN